MSANYLRRLGGAIAITSALAGGALWAPTTQAVNLADDGLGEVALYQYYTAKSGWQTFFRIINTSDDMVPVKVRFRRATDSEDVLDFVVALSPYDMWVGWTDANVDGNGNPGVITWDTSCLAPAPLPNNNPGGWVSNPDNNRKYVTFKAPGAAEGHVEMISLGRTGPLLNVTTDLYADTLHNPATDKPVCARFGNALAPGVGSFQDKLATSLQFLEPNNTLKANGYLINSATGQGVGFNPVMLANFFNPIQIDDSVPALLGEILQQIQLGDFSYPDTIGSPLIAALFDDKSPNLNFAWPRASQVQVDTPFNLLDLVEQLLLDDGGLQVSGPATVVDEWDRGIDAVSAVLTRRSVINEWAARETNGANVSIFEMEWIATFPTRYPPSENYYYPYVNDGVPVIAPFDEGVTPVHFGLWNREERSNSCVSGIGQDAPCQPNGELPYEVNVITFRGDNRGPTFPANRLGSDVVTNVPESQLPIPFNPGEFLGWMEMSFTGDGANAGLGSDNRGNQVYDNFQVTYNLGETVFLSSGGVNMEYCLYDLLTAGNAAPGPCTNVDPQNICVDGTQVAELDIFGPGVSQVSFEITGPAIFDVDQIQGPESGRLVSTLILTGSYARPYVIGSEVEPIVDAAPVCPPETAGVPTGPGTNPLLSAAFGGAHYKGAPVIGFATGVYNLGSQSANYATAVDHGYKRDITFDDACPALYRFLAGPETGWFCIFQEPPSPGGD